MAKLGNPNFVPGKVPDTLRPGRPKGSKSKRLVIKNLVRIKAQKRLFKHAGDLIDRLLTYALSGDKAILKFLAQYFLVKPMHDLEERMLELKIERERLEIEILKEAPTKLEQIKELLSSREMNSIVEQIHVKENEFLAQREIEGKPKHEVN